MKSWNIFSREEREDEQVAPVQKEKDVLYTERLFEEYKSAQRKWADQAREDSEFRHNIIFTKEQRDAIEGRGLAPIGIPLLHQAVEQAVSMLTANSPTFQATAREDSDVRVAKLFSDLLSYVWYISDGNQRLKQAVDDYYVKGRGVLYAFVNPEADLGRGEVQIMDLDPLEVFPDPNSRDRLWRDAGHIIVSRPITREQADATWPSLQEQIAKAQPEDPGEFRGTGKQAIEDQQLAGDFFDTHHTRYRLLERYSKVKVVEFHIKEEEEERVLTKEKFEAFQQEPAFIVETQQGVTFALSETDVAEFSGLFEQFGPQVPIPGQSVGENGELQEEIQIITLYPTTKGMLAAEAIIPVREVQVTRVEVLCTLGGVRLYKYILPTEHYPLIPLNNRHDRNPYPMSDARFVRPAIQEFNKTQQIIMAHAASVAGAKYWVREGMVDDGIEERLANPAPAVLTFRGETPPLPHQTHQLPSEFYLNQDRLKGWVHEILGLYPSGQGDPTNSPETFRGTLQIDEFNLRRIKSKLDDIYAGLNQLAKVSIDLMQDVYTHEKVIRLVQPNGDETQVEINKALYDSYGRVVDLINDITTVDADVIVVSGSTMPSNRYALLDYYLQFFNANIIDDVEVLKKSEIFDREGVLQRKSMMAQMQQRIAQLEDENKSLSGDLQTREREVYHAKQQEALAKFKGSLEEPKARVKKTAELFEQRSNDQLKEQQSLINTIDRL